jgi:hypothetical protein
MAGTKKIFDYYRNTSEHPQTLRSRAMEADRHVDELPCAPGGHLPVDHDRFTVQPGQIVRVPIKYVLDGNFHKRTFFSKVTFEDFVAAQKMTLGEAAKVFACPYCEKQYKTEAGLASHVAQKHEGLDEDAGAEPESGSDE